MDPGFLQASCFLIGLFFTVGKIQWAQGMHKELRESSAAHSWSKTALSERFVWLNEGLVPSVRWGCSNRWRVPWQAGTVRAHPSIGFTAEYLLPTGFTHHILVFASSRMPQRRLPGSPYWARRISIFATASAGCHYSGFLFIDYVKCWVHANCEPDCPTLQADIRDAPATVAPDINTFQEPE